MNTVGAARSRTISASPALLVVVALACGCTDIRLAAYRNDALAHGYKYVLGEQYTTVGDLRLCYQDLGAGDPVLILPGLATSIDLWQFNVPALAERHRVLALDLPGFGKSGKPDSSYELPWICEQIVAFMDRTGVQRASFIGGSMGGHLALLMALNHPERVDKLVLMGSVGAWPPPNFLLDLGFKLLYNEAIVTDFLRGRWPEIHRLLFKHETEYTRGLFAYQMARRADGALFAPEGRAATRALKSIFYNSCRARLGDVHQPVLLIWGDSDEIHPPEEGFYMRRRLPDSRLVLVPDAAHEAMVDNPQFFNATVLAFLKDGTAGVSDSTEVTTD